MDTFGPVARLKTAFGEHDGRPLMAESDFGFATNVGAQPPAAADAPQAARAAERKRSAPIGWFRSL
jgi:hypothetical protein